jgi:hypothetical protein
LKLLQINKIAIYDAMGYKTLTFSMKGPLMVKSATLFIFAAFVAFSIAGVAQSSEGIELSNLPVTDPAQAVWVTIEQEAIFKFDAKKNIPAVEDDLYFQNGAVLPLSVKPQEGVPYCKLDLQETPETATASKDFAVKKGSNFKVRALGNSQRVSGKAVRLDLNSPSIVEGAVSVIENLLCVSATANKAVTVEEVSAITGGAVSIQYGYLPKAAPGAYLPSRTCAPLAGSIPFLVPVITTDAFVRSTSTGTYDHVNVLSRTVLSGSSANGAIKIMLSEDGMWASGVLSLSPSARKNFLNGLQQATGGALVVDPDKVCVSDLMLDFERRGTRLYGTVSISVGWIPLFYPVRF